MTAEQCIKLMRKFIWCGWDNHFLKTPYDLTQAVINPYYDEWIDRMISLSKREQERKIWLESIRDLIEFVAKAVYIGDGGITKKRRSSTNTHYVLISYKGSVRINEVEQKFVAYITESCWLHSHRLIVLFGEHEQVMSDVMRLNLPLTRQPSVIYYVQFKIDF